MVPRMKIRSRMFLLFVGTGLLIFIAAIAYLSARYRNFTFEKTKDLAVEQVTRYSAEVRAHLDYDMGVARTMARTLESFSHLPYDEIAPLMENFLTGILAGHRSYIDVFGQWELNHIDPTYQKKHGRLRISYHRKNADIVKLTDTLNVLEEDKGIYDLPVLLFIYHGECPSFSGQDPRRRHSGIHRHHPVFQGREIHRPDRDGHPPGHLSGNHPPDPGTCIRTTIAPIPCC